MALRSRREPGATAHQRTATDLVPIAKFDRDPKKFKDLLTGFIRLHILRHAAGHEIYGQWMIKALAKLWQVDAVALLESP